MSLPFAGFVETRPYPATGLTTARWRKEVRPAYVNFADLILTQRAIRIPPLFGVECRPESDAFPHVVAWSGQLYLEDGHHRVVRQAITCPGVAGMVMRVHYIKEPTEEIT